MPILSTEISPDEYSWPSSSPNKVRDSSPEEGSEGNEEDAGGVRLSLTKATSAVILGLALTAAPTFAFAVQGSAVAQAAPADGAQAQATGQTVEIKDHLFQDDNKNLHDALVNENVGTINIASGGSWMPSGGWLASRDVITVDRELTINVTTDDYTELANVEFVVANGGKLTFNNVIVNDTLPASQTPDLYNTYLPVKVEDGGTFTTTGKGVLINNNGNNNGDEYHKGYALYLTGGATANLNADTNVKADGIDNGVEGAYGTYASESAVFAEAGSTLNITKGNFISENHEHSTIQSAGRVNVNAASIDDVDISTLRLNGNQAVLNAKNLLLHYLQPGPSDPVTGEDKINGTLELHDGAKAYLTDSVVDAIGGDSGISTNAVYVDGSSKVYEQESELNSESALSQRKDNATGYDNPSFSGFKSYYQGDHLTKNQYYVQGVIDSANAVREDVINPNHALGLWKLKAKPDDLESQVNAEAIKLTEGAQDDQDASGSSTLSAYLPLGISHVYGKYEISKYSPNEADIAGDGHVYAYSVVHDLQAGWDVSSYRSGSEYTAPEGNGQTTSGVEGDVAPAGYVFAGWYTKGGDLRTGAASNDYSSSVPGFDDLQKAEDPASDHELGKDAKDGYAYAKFVPATLLEAGTQFKSNGNQSKLRFLMALDSYNYNGVGFTVTDADGNDLGNGQELTTSMAYDYMLAENHGKPDQKVYAGEVFPTDEKLPLLLARVSLTDLAADYSGTVKVTGYWITPDGTKVSGKTVTVTVDGKGGVTATKQADSSLSGSANASN